MGATRRAGKQKTSPATIQTRERERQALELRKAGVTYDVIAQKLGYKGKGTAYEAVMRALKYAVQPDATEYLNLELSRLDDMTKAVWADARQGDAKAIDQVLKIMDRRAKYLGLDTNEKRFADAVEKIADSSQAQAVFLYTIMNNVLNQLDLTDEQRGLAPAIIMRQLEAIEPGDNQKAYEDDILEGEVAE